MDDTWQPVPAFLTRLKINYPVIIGNEALSRSYGAASLPLTLLIDRNGNVAVRHAGLIDKQECENQIRSLLLE